MCVWFHAEQVKGARKIGTLDSGILCSFDRGRTGRRLASRSMTATPPDPRRPVMFFLSFVAGKLAASSTLPPHHFCMFALPPVTVHVRSAAAARRSRRTSSTPREAQSLHGCGRQVRVTEGTRERPSTKYHTRTVFDVLWRHFSSLHRHPVCLRLNARFL